MEELKEKIRKIEEEREEFSSLCSSGYQNSVDSILSRLKGMETMDCRLSVQNNGKYLDVSLNSMYGTRLASERILYDVRGIPDCCHPYRELERVYSNLKKNLK